MKAKKLNILISLATGLILVIIFMSWFNVIRDPINIIPGQIFLNRGYPIQFFGPSNENLSLPYLKPWKLKYCWFPLHISIPTFLANWIFGINMYPC